LPPPAVGAALAQPEELVADRRNMVGDVPLDRLEERRRLVRHGEVVEVGLGIEFGHGLPPAGWMRLSANFDARASGG